MGKLNTIGRALLVSSIVLAGSGHAFADSLSDSIEQFLADTDKTIEDTKIWKIHVRPALTESVIWTDNVFLNDRGEKALSLQRILTPSGQSISFSPKRARAIERRLLPDSGKIGREDDFIIRSKLDLDFEIPVNPEVSRVFDDVDSITVLSAEVSNQEYLDLNELDNTSFTLGTDLFGFVGDLIDFQAGNRIWVRGRNEFSRVTDPLDATFRFLARDGIGTISTFRDFERDENTANLDIGYEGGRVNAEVGYTNYSLELEDNEFQTAGHSRHTWHAEADAELPFWAEKRGYVRYDFSLYKFDRAPVLSRRGTVLRHEKSLNDADVHRAVVGVKGLMFSQKLRGQVEAGYLTWDPRSDSTSGDTTSYNGIVGRAKLAYKPFEERKTQFQFSYDRVLGYSSISNFNASHQVLVSVIHDIVPKRWDFDGSVSFVRTEPSDGPTRNLYELGLGVVYHVFPQMDLSFRYLGRYQESSDEIAIRSAFGRPNGSTVFYELQSDGDFYQNILELGLTLHF